MAETEGREQKGVNQNQGQDSSQNPEAGDLHDKLRMVSGSVGNMLRWKKGIYLTRVGSSLYEEEKKRRSMPSSRA